MRHLWQMICHFCSKNGWKNKRILGAILSQLHMIPSCHTDNFFWKYANLLGTLAELMTFICSLNWKSRELKTPYSISLEEALDPSKLFNVASLWSFSTDHSLLFLNLGFYGNDNSFCLSILEYALMHYGVCTQSPLRRVKNPYFCNFCIGISFEGLFGNAPSEWASLPPKISLSGHSHIWTWLEHSYWVNMGQNDSKRDLPACENSRRGRNLR